MTRRTKPPELDPRRDPAWRWTLAGRENSVGITDRPARAARQYRRAWAACRTDADRRLLETRMPTHSAAHALYRDGRSRAALEVRVLAGEPAADIARKAGLPPSVVEAFEVVFFDVRSRLGATDFIHHVVIGAGTDEAAAWMALAYAGGPVVADALLGPGPAAARPQRPEDVPAFLEEAARAAARRLAAAASRNPTAAAARAAVVRAADRSGGRPRPDDTARHRQLEQHIRAMLDEIPWVSGSDAERPGAVPPAVAAFDTLPGELRDDELLRLSTGQEIPGLAEELAVPLPPPRKQKKSVLLPDDQPPAAPPPPPPPPPAGPPRPGPGAGRPKGGRPT